MTTAHGAERSLSLRTQRRRQITPSPMTTAVEAWVSARGSGTAIDPFEIPKEIELPARSVRKLSGDGAIVIVSVPERLEELTA